MKLLLSTAFPVGLAGLLFVGSNIVFADAKNEIIDKQQDMTQTEMDAAKKAKPGNEARPAATTSQSKHSTESPKGDMIKKQKSATDQAVDDAEAAKPDVENRPAATTSQNKHSTESPKADMIKKQKKTLNQSVQ